MRCYILFLPCLLLVSTKSTAQNTNYFGFFPTIDHSGQFADRWNYSVYIFGAFNFITNQSTGKPDNSGFFVFYSEEAITFAMSDKLSLTGAYVYERQRPFDKDEFRNENRFYFQTTLKSKLGALGLKNRIRYDGRFIQDRESHQTPYTSRLRYLIGATMPIGTVTDRFYLTAYNEMFFDTYSNPTVVYSENWAYAGVGLHTKGAGTFELGPLYIFWVANKQRDLLNFFYVQLSWITHLDLRKPN